MKKKITSLLVAVVLVLSQAVIFPLAASADTWVDDDTAAGGGYWIDDEGYIIEDNSQAAPEPVQEIIIGNEETTEEKESAPAPVFQSRNGAEPKNESSATSASLTAIVSTDPTALQFSVTADGEVSFQFSGTSSSPSYNYSNGILSIFDSKGTYTVAVCNAEGSKVLAMANSMRAHSYSVVYNLEGNTKNVSSGNLSFGEDTVYTAPLFYTDNGIEYELVGGANNAAQILSYGTNNYEFKYQVYNPTDLVATVTYVDQKDNVLGSVSQPVVYKGGNVVFTLPETIDKDSRTFVKADNTTRITVNYFSSNLNYTVKYREKAYVDVQPYSVKVQYVDADTNAVIGNSMFNITADSIANGSPVAFTIPDEVSYQSDDTITYYQVVAGQSISHNPADNTNLSYTIKYKKVAADAPYTWSIRLIDTATGAILDTAKLPVTVTKGVSYAADSQITVDGVKYLLDSNMEKEYTHNYGDARVLNIYYNAEGSVVLNSYDLKIQYIDIATNAVLESKIIPVNAENPNVDINTDESFAGNDVSYVRLLGQNTLTHNFYSPQRTYSVYYRDVNDVQNADTVIVREEVITTTETTEITETVTTTPTTVADNTEAAEDNTPVAPVIPATAGEGDQNTVAVNGDNAEVIDDEKAPLADNGEEEIKDEDAPKSDGLKDNTSDNGFAEGYSNNSMHLTWLTWASIIAGVIIIGLIAFFVVNKMKKSNK